MLCPIHASRPRHDQESRANRGGAGPVRSGRGAGPRGIVGLGLILIISQAFFSGPASRHPLHDVGHTLPSAHIHRMLIGARNFDVVPDSTSRLQATNATNKTEAARRTTNIVEQIWSRELTSGDRVFFPWACF